jgi:hypothetical protein
VQRVGTKWFFTGSNDQVTDNMQTVTTYKFKDFQHKIVPIIQKIIGNEKSMDHPFIQRWLNVTKGGKITTSSTFRAVA